MLSRPNTLSTRPRSRQLVSLKGLVSVCALTVVVYQLAHNRRFYSGLDVELVRLLAAGGLMAVSKWFSAERYRLLVREAGVRMASADLIRLYWQGMFYNQFLPGSVGGDGFKVWQLHRHGGGSLRKLATLTLLDRVIGLVPLVALLLIAAWARLPQLGISGGLCLLLVLAMYAVFVGGLRWFMGWTVRRQLLLHLYSVGVQLTQCLMTVYIVWSLGYTDELGAYLFLFLASSLGTALPITVGGIGIREIVFSAGASYVGIPAEQAMLIGFIVYCLSLLVATPGGFFKS